MNAEQKQRAKDALQKWHSSNDDSQREYQSAELMAALLQELIDAPEVDPVATVTGYYGGHLSISTIDGRVLPAGTALYLAPPAPVPVAWRYEDAFGTHFTEDYSEISNIPGVLSFTALFAAPPHQSEHHLEMVNTPAPSVPDGWRSFLTDVITSAGLLEHGKRDKGLASRIGKFAFDAMRGSTPTPAEAPADLVQRLIDGGPQLFPETNHVNRVKNMAIYLWRQYLESERDKLKGQS